MRLLRRVSLLAVLCLPLAAGCGDVKGYMDVATGLHQVFPEGEFHVSEDEGDEGVVLITVKNAGQKTPAERAAAARRAGEHVRDHFPQYEHVKAVKVVYTGDAASSALADASTFVVTREQLAQPDPAYDPPARPGRRPGDVPPPMNMDSFNAHMDSIRAQADSSLAESRRQVEKMMKDMEERTRGL